MTIDIPSRLNAIRHELEASGVSRRLLMDIAVEATSIVLTALNRYDRAQFEAEEGGNELAWKSESQVLDELGAAFKSHRPPYEPEFILDLVAVMAGDEAEIILDLEPPDYWGGLADVSFAYPDSPGPSHVIVHEPGKRLKSKSESSADKTLICTTLCTFWLSGQSPTAQDVADAAACGAHSVRLFGGAGVGGRGGLTLDQAEAVISLPADGDGASPRIRKVVSYPPTKRNWSKAVVFLNEQGTEPCALAAQLDLESEDDLIALIDAAE